jgi:hypothetical protein
MRFLVLRYIFLLTVPMMASVCVWAQQSHPPASPAAKPATPDTATIPADVIRPVLGPYDTIIVSAQVIDHELLSARTMPYTWVRAPMTPAMRRRLEEWTKLRNAVYVTYPYARKAGVIINDINAKMALLGSEKERNAYLKSREKDLRKEFTDPLEQMSVYQGKILMKLINRQTGNNCYELIKDYKGGLSARFYQTVAFFFSTSLKQPYDSKGDDQAIESIVQEIERMYRS